MNSIRTDAERNSLFGNNRIDVPIYGQAKIQPVFRYFSLIAGALRDKSCKLTAFSYSYSAQAVLVLVLVLEWRNRSSTSRSTVSLSTIRSLLQTKPAISEKCLFFQSIVAGTPTDRRSSPLRFLSCSDSHAGGSGLMTEH